MKFYIEPDEVWNYCLENEEELTQKLVCVMENDLGLGVYVTQDGEELLLVLMDEDEVVELETFEFYTKWDLDGIIEKLTLRLTMYEEGNMFTEEEIREAFEEFIYRINPTEDTLPFTDEAYEAVMKLLNDLGFGL